jgi:hypothetical protein
MASLSSVSGAAVGVALAPAPAKPRARGFLHIVRHGAGPGSVYVLTYHRLERPSPGPTEDEAPVGARHAVPVPDAVTEGGPPQVEPRPTPVVAEGAQDLITLLERIGVDFHLAEVRGALEDILRLGSANIPDLWLSDDDLLEKGLAES